MKLSFFNWSPSALATAAVLPIVSILPIVSVLAVCTSAAMAQSDRDIIAAYESDEIDEQQFKLLINEIAPSSNEEKWRQTAWIPGIWEGIKLAEKQQKPIFLWAMNGDPLGCV